MTGTKYRINATDRESWTSVTHDEIEIAAAKRRRFSSVEAAEEWIKTWAHDDDAMGVFEVIKA